MGVIYDGKSTEGLAFFELLCRDDNFCSAFGRCTLVATKLEATLRGILEKHNIKAPKKATLGNLIEDAERKNILEPQMIAVLKHKNNQRNHIVHNIYLMLTGRIEKPFPDDKPFLPNENLLDSDVWTYTDYVREFYEDTDRLVELLDEFYTNQEKLFDSLA